MRPVKTSKKTRRRRFTHGGKPVIGITCEVKKLKPYFSEADLLLDYRYVRAIIRAGGIPILLPLNPFFKDVTKLIDLIDGLVIVGGADIPPSFYGEKKRDVPHEPMYRGRIYFEKWLYAEAQKKKIPVLAICYGMQLLNVIYGGTLHQDIKKEVRNSNCHDSPDQPLHRVHIKEGTFYYKIFREKSIWVHSQHHQAVKQPGRSLKVTVYSEDGIPEAIEGLPQTIAVQWHPEFQPKDPVQMRMFRYFIEMARAKIRKHSPR